jgi:TetR/AcrR family transcriptional regulator, regulator of autoinduction and epiphytic fitness
VTVKRPSFRERQQQAREAAILEAAGELLIAKGYAAMTMDDVAAAVGISKATLYQHFPSKEELTVGVGIAFVGRLYDYLIALDPRLPALERLQRIMCWVIELRAAAEQRLRQTSTGGLYHTIRPLVNQHPGFQAARDRLVSAFCDLIDTARVEGDLTTEIPTPILVQAMLSLARDFDYAELLASMPVSPESLSQNLVSIFLNGVRATRNP